ncbi:MAG: hypothetical protein HC915_13030, partial [Anaerolineae bacterium]|nr:hypothetical protein [Anaerolineae bacterium]
MFDPGGLLNLVPIIDAAPPQSASPTPVIAVADIVIAGVSIAPEPIAVGRPFTITVVLRNTGTVPASGFSVTGILSPGPVYATSYVDSLPANAEITVLLPARLDAAGAFVGDVIVDYNNDILETEEGETNNTFRLNYTVDFAVVNQRNNEFVRQRGRLDRGRGLSDLGWDWR